MELAIAVSDLAQGPPDAKRANDPGRAEGPVPYFGHPGEDDGDGVPLPLLCFHNS